MVNKVVILTPAVGSRHLRQAVLSVKNQSYKNIEHWVVIDGASREAAVRRQLQGISGVVSITLPQVTGADGFQGHRIYAAIPMTMNCDYVAYLDEDNWYERDHVAKMVSLMMEFDLDWTYSLRGIVTQNGDPLCLDDCNSLGRWPSYDGSYQHVDTSCYMLKRKVAAAVSGIWNHSDSDPEGAADRLLAKHLMCHYPFFHTTSAYSLNYRIGSRQSEQGASRFYETGNEIHRMLYRHFPWRFLKVKGRCPIHPHLDFCVDPEDEHLIGGALYREMSVRAQMT